MSKRTYTPTAPATTAPRVIHYIDPSPRADLIAYTAAEIAARRHEQRVLYARWRARQDAIAEREATVRRYLVRAFVVLAVGILAAVGVLGWMVYRAVSHAAHAAHASGAGHAGGVTGGDMVLGGLAVAFLLAVVGGHRCVTVVQHWH